MSDAFEAHHMLSIYETLLAHEAHTRSNWSVTIANGGRVWTLTIGVGDCLYENAGQDIGTLVRDGAEWAESTCRALRAEGSW